MNQPSSSISSSETPVDAAPETEGKAPAGGKDSLAMWGWALLWLVVIDFAVGALFAYPDDPKDINPSPLALYFDYGRSMEGRLRRATRADPAASAPITQSGWYAPLQAVTRDAKPGATEVTVYGMSHAVRLAEALHEVAPNYVVRSVGAPGASMNWAYGAFLRDKGLANSKVAVLAVMSSTLPMVLSPAPMNWNTSFAMPYTADRFVMAPQGLKRIPPPYESFADYVATLDDPARWQAALATFRKTDPFYDPFLVQASWLDNSTIVRLVRRAWAQRRDQATRGDVLTARGYRADSEAVLVANGIVADFAKTARARGLVPVIYVVDSFGYGDQLSRALRETLVRDRIPFLSSSSLVDPGNPTAYLPDSHFTDANDRKLAQGLAAILDRELGAGQSPATR